MSSNVIKFPKMRLDTPAVSEEELLQKITDYKKSFADDISEFLWNHVLAELSRSGCNFDEDFDELYPSMVLVLESIRSLHLHANNVDHPLQDFAVNGMEIVKEEVDIEP